MDTSLLLIVKLCKKLNLTARVSTVVSPLVVFILFACLFIDNKVRFHGFVIQDSGRVVINLL